MIGEAAQGLIRDFEASLALENPVRRDATLFTGVDLGTATIVTAVVDEAGTPVAGAVTRSGRAIRDGLILDYMAALGILRRQVAAIRGAGFPILSAMAAFPPGTEGRNARAFANCLDAAGLECIGLTDEPSAAALVLGIREGAVVDIGGGTTGISVLREGEVVATADEATGGTHLDLVLAGHFKVPVEDAERMKTDASRQRDLFPLVRPVFQKMAAIAREHINGHPVTDLYLVGGTSSFPGIAEVFLSETGLPAHVPGNPMLVTPLGIALACRAGGLGSSGCRP